MLQKITEKRFLELLKANQPSPGSLNLSYRKSDSSADSLSSSLVDKLLIKGLKHDRSLNDSNHDYIMIDAQEGQGIRYFMHKYFVGFHYYYLHSKNEKFFGIEAKDEAQSQGAQAIMDRNKMAREMHFKLKKEMSESSLSFILRVTVNIKSRGKVVNEKEPENDLYDPNYTGNHIVIFENQLK